jgi:hypothetical protein
MNNNAIIINNYGRLQYHIFSSKFPSARERISSKFVDNLGTRHQKILQPCCVHYSHILRQFRSCTAEHALSIPAFFTEAVRHLDGRTSDRRQV